jgi:hypothetical protein
MFLAILMVLYPIIPSVALIVLLWVRPKDKSSGMRLRAMSSFSETMKNTIAKPEPPKKKDYDFRDVEFLAMIAHAIAGGVESPLQLAFQVSFLDTYLVNTYAGPTKSKAF